MVQSNSNNQRASLVVQRQSLVDGIDVVFRQTNAGGCHVLDEVGELDPPRTERIRVRPRTD